MLNEISLKDQLFYEAQGVKNCVKILKQRIKEEQKFLKETDWYYIPDDKIRQETSIKSLISVKISLEKYGKKLKHISKEM